MCISISIYIYLLGGWVIQVSHSQLMPTHRASCSREWGRGIVFVAVSVSICVIKIKSRENKMWMRF